MKNITQYRSFISQIEKLKAVDFNLPTELEANRPPEERGLKRDEVKLMVSYTKDNKVIHDRFFNLDNYIESGDLIVVNTSKTMCSSVDATRGNGQKMKLHLSTHLPSDLWIVEMRTIDGNTTKPFYDLEEGEVFGLPDGGTVTLHKHYNYRFSEQNHQSKRLWIATLDLPKPIKDYLRIHGKPIHYSYVKQDWSIDYYQTVYATEEGSAEMPSAGRAFSFELITRLIAKGVKIVPLILHTGVSSLEGDELPYEEYYDIPLETAKLINETRKSGKKVIAVGTTVIRALETVTDEEGNTHPGKGWTNILITPDYKIRSVNSMLTGLHEPRATHLAMLQGLVSLQHLDITYSEALKEKYLWHEFGDLHLLFA